MWATVALSHFNWPQALLYTILYSITYFLIIFFFSFFLVHLLCFECQDDVRIMAFSVFDRKDKKDDHQ